MDHTLENLSVRDNFWDDLIPNVRTGAIANKHLFNPFELTNRNF